MKARQPGHKAPKRGHELWWLVSAFVVTGGCSGIQATKSVSPLDFLLPGLHMQHAPPEPVAPAGTNMMVCRLEGFAP
jgi:hypothetical protein